MLGLASIQVLALGPHIDPNVGNRAKDESEKKMSRNGSGQGLLFRVTGGPGAKAG